MEEGKRDRRATPRVGVCLPVLVQYGKSGKSGGSETIAAETRDISSRGICFYMHTPIEEGTEVEFTLTMPFGVTLAEGIRAHCKGKVVRLEPSTPGRRVGVAVRIDAYQFINEALNSKRG